MNKIPPFLRTKYSVATFALFFWITFLHNNDLISQVSSRVKLQLLKNEQQYYRDEIENTKEAIHDLTTNVESLEKFAREHHHMKKENEDLYLVITEDKN
jgi:cell division protein FtsB